MAGKYSPLVGIAAAAATFAGSAGAAPRPDATSAFSNHFCDAQGSDYDRTTFQSPERGRDPDYIATAKLMANGQQIHLHILTKGGAIIDADGQIDQSRTQINITRVDISTLNGDRDVFTFTTPGSQYARRDTYIGDRLTDTTPIVDPRSLDRLDDPIIKRLGIVEDAMKKAHLKTLVCREPEAAELLGAAAPVADPASTGKWDSAGYKFSPDADITHNQIISQPNGPNTAGQDLEYTTSGPYGGLFKVHANIIYNFNQDQTNFTLRGTIIDPHGTVGQLTANGVATVILGASVIQHWQVTTKDGGSHQNDSRVRGDIPMILAPIDIAIRTENRGINAHYSGQMLMDNYVIRGPINFVAGLLRPKDSGASPDTTNGRSATPVAPPRVMAGPSP